jgi:hypothetical protein
MKPEQELFVDVEQVLCADAEKDVNSANDLQLLLFAKYIFIIKSVLIEQSEQPVFCEGSYYNYSCKYYLDDSISYE